MPALIFKLNGVPEDEADDVRALLDENEIEYYETHAGRWGVSMPGIWLSDEEQLVEARTLIDTYQRERSTRLNQEWNELEAQGNLPSVWSKFLHNPIRMALALLAIGVVIGLSIYPFLDLLDL